MLNMIASPTIIALSILLLVLQFFLSFRKNKLFGFIPALIIMIVAVSLTIYSTYEISQYSKETLTSHTGNGYEMNITIRYDKDGNPMDFSNVSIYDQDDKLIDSVHMEFDKKGNIIKDDYSRVYVKDIKSLIGDRILTGSPTYDEDVDNMIKMKDNGYYSPLSFIFIVFIPCVALLLIHLIIRTAIKKRRLKQELNKIDIENL